MPSTSSHRSDTVRLSRARDLDATVTRLPRRSGVEPRGSARTAAHGCHVLVVGGNEPGGRCGIAAHTAGLVEHLAGTTASVTVLAPGPRAAATPGGPASPPAGLELGRGGGTGGRRRAGEEFGVLSHALAVPLPRVPDVVLGVMPGLGAAVAAARLARRHGVPLILVAHDLVSARPEACGGRGLTVAAAAERRLLRAAAEVAVVAPELAPYVRSLGVGPEHLHFLPHWAPSEFDPADRLAARRALGWPLRGFTIVLSAAGTRPDLATVHAAAALLPQQIHLVLAADGTRRCAPPVQAGGPDRVRRVGPLDDAGHRLALTAADLLLLVDRPEATGLSLPGTLAHYLAAGRPVLAATSATGSVAAELARAAGAGRLVRPGDAELLVAAIRELQADQAGRLAMGRAARRYAVERLDHAGTMRRLDALLRAAVEATVVDVTTA